MDEDSNQWFRRSLFEGRALKKGIILMGITAATAKRTRIPEKQIAFLYNVLFVRLPPVSQDTNCFADIILLELRFSTLFLA